MAPRIEMMAKKLDERVIALSAEVRRRDTDPGQFLRQLDAIKAQRLHTRQLLSQMDTRVRALRKEYRRASSNPYR